MTGAPRGAAGGKRLDVQGLRMVAVVAVVANHLTGHPRGGFVGVDVFFVISGFLITGHLVRDAGRGVGPWGCLGAFYRRRVRRLFPAALVVVVATIAVAHQVVNGPVYRQTWHDGLWAAAFGANWHFVSARTDYFTASGPTSAFEHYWSLSVEEQFYVGWPIAVYLVIGALAARHRGSVDRRRLAVGAAATLLTVASLGYAVHLSTADPAVAYFSTLARGWELGLGAVLACLTPYVRARTSVLTALSWTGLAAIGLSVFLVTGGSGFPAPGAVLPCVGAALVLVAVAPDARARNVVLTNRASVFVGDVSYAVYLVHFPVIVLLAAWMGQTDGYYYAAALVLTAGLSLAVYALVEQPVLRSRWLRPRVDRPRPRPTPQPRPTPGPGPVAGPPLGRLVGAGAALAVVGVVVLVAWPGTEAALAHRREQIARAAATAPAPVADPLQEALTAKIGQALLATGYPVLHPTIDSVLTHRQVSNEVLRCGSVVLQPAAGCTFGPATATHTAYVVGDSTAMGYSEAYRRLVAGGDWRIRVASVFGCDFTRTLVQGATKSTQDRCLAHNRADVAEIARTKPDLVLVTNTYEPRTDVATGRTLTDAQWAATLSAELARVASPTTRVALVSPPADEGEVRDCYHEGGSPTACVYRLTARWQSRAAAERALAARQHWAFVDSAPWFCSASGYCPAFAGGVPTRFDFVHASTPYLQAIAPVLGEAFAAQHLLGR